MGDLKSPKLIYLKGILFLVGGVIASATILLEHPDWKLAVLLVVAVWCFARAYYFAFYVIEHYVDSSYHFAGLGSFFTYLLKRRMHPQERSGSADDKSS